MILQFKIRHLCSTGYIFNKPRRMTTKGKQVIFQTLKKLGSKWKYLFSPFKDEEQAVNGKIFPLIHNFRWEHKSDLRGGNSPHIH